MNSREMSDTVRAYKFLEKDMHTTVLAYLLCIGVLPPSWNNGGYTELRIVLEVGRVGWYTHTLDDPGYRDSAVQYIGFSDLDVFTNSAQGKKLIADVKKNGGKPTIQHLQPETVAYHKYAESMNRQRFAAMGLKYPA